MNDIVAADETREQSLITVSLVLGSGGARGLAQIGIIRWLEENGFRIAAVAGCSIGSVVGGVYALGKLEEFADWVSAITPLELWKLMDFSFGQAGLVKGDKIINTLRTMTGESLIEELPIPFTAVAADIIDEKEIWIDRGPLFEAIRASAALPFLLEPVERKGRQLLDGGILNPVPIAPTFKENNDLIIAVNLSGAPDPNFAALPSRSEVPTPDNEEKSSFSRRIDQFIDSLKIDRTSRQFDGYFSVANQAFDAMQGTIARQKLAAYPPDFTLELPRNLCGILEFDRARELIDVGYTLAEKQLSGVSIHRD